MFLDRGIVAVLATTLLVGLGDSQCAAQKRRSPVSTEPSTRATPNLPLFENTFGTPTAEQLEELDKVEISGAEERQFGGRIIDAYLDDLHRQKLKVAKRGRDVEYLRDLVKSVQPFMKNGERYRSIKVYVVDSPLTDARSIPGGTLVFYRGLLDFAESEAAIVGVVGHELSHLDRGHQLAPLRRIKQFEEGLTPGHQGFQPDKMMLGIRAIVEGYARPFRPEDESDADHDGTRWAFQAGYDPREFAELFLKLHRRDGDKAAPIPFLQTHPFRLDRYRTIHAQYLELQTDSPQKQLYVGRENLMQRVSRSKREFRKE